MFRSKIRSATRSVRRTAAAAAICGICLCLSVRAEAVADDPKQLFDSVFGGRYKDVLRTRDTADDLALAVELIESAATVKDSPAFSVLLYTKAYELAKRDAGGLEIADRSLTNLATVEGQKTEDIAGKRIELYEEQFRRERDQREAIGNLLVDLYIEHAGTLIHGQKIDEAFVVYRKASGIARAVKSPRTAELADLRRQAALHKRIAIKLKSLHSKLDGGDTGAADEIIQTYLVELDDPMSASEFALVSTNAILKEMVKLAGEPLNGLDEKQALQLAKWYDLQSRTAQVGELAALTRAEAYYKRFFEQHANSDTASFAAGVALKGVQKKLAGRSVKTTLVASSVGSTTVGAGPSTTGGSTNSGTGAKSGPVSTKLTGAMGEKICDTLAAKSSVRGLVAEGKAFSGPDGDGRRGANGLAFEVDRRVTVLGTRWSGEFRRAGTARGVHLIHPHQGGHVIVTMWHDRLNVNTEGGWGGYGGRSAGVKVEKTAEYAKRFPLPSSKDIYVISEISANGQFRFFVDKVLVLSGRIQSAKPLTLPGDFKHGGEAVVLTPKHAAAIIGPRDRGENIFSGVHFYPGVGK